MDLTHYNLNEICNNYNNADTTKLAKESLPTEFVNNYDLLTQLTIHAGSLPIIRNDNGLISCTAINDHLKFTNNKFLFGVIRILDILPRSIFIKCMSKTPEYAALTPLMLYAVKRDQGYMYEEWDKEDINLPMYLGRGLKGVLDKEPEEVANINDIREYYFRVKSTGKLKALTSYPHFTKDEYKGRSRVQNIIKAQMWLANAAIRSDAMILDLNDWDNRPDAIDSIVEEDPINKKVLDIPW